jgi:hypothetical protein
MARLEQQQAVERKQSEQLATELKIARIKISEFDEVESTLVESG